MKENKLTKFVGNCLSFADEHQREIFLGTQIVGTIMTGLLFYKAGTKADDILAKHKEKFETIDKEERRKETIDTVKDMAPIFIPPIITGALTIGCAIGGYKASTRQIAALSAAYTLSEKALDKYTSKAEELLGHKKATSIQDEVNADTVRTNPPSKNEVYITGRGETLCYDDYSGRYFKSDPESIRKAVNDINEQLRDEYYVELNEFYDKLGLANVKLGDDIGFCINDGYMNLSFSATLTENNTPCLVLNYDVSPKYGTTVHTGRYY